MKKVAYLLLFLLIAQLTRCYYANVNKYVPINPPDHGQRLEINGEKFRIIYIGGVRFRFPDNDTFIWPSLVGDGINIHLDWPNIPPGRSPGTKYVEWYEGKIRRNNQVELQVIGKEDAIKIDPNQTVEQLWNLSSSKYVVHDDLALGLRVYSPKEAPSFPAYAVSLTDDAFTPLDHQPVMVWDGGSIYFYYAPKVEVRVHMMGWGGMGMSMGKIDPNWKSTYLGVLETLNKYREDKQ